LAFRRTEQFSATCLLPTGLCRPLSMFKDA
jgi:hypothetical protein